MHEYLKRLIREKKDLQTKRDNINKIVDSSLGKRDYLIKKYKYFWKIRDINIGIKEINKKIEFVINLKSVMEAEYEKQIIEGNIYFKRNKEESLGKRPS